MHSTQRPGPFALNFLSLTIGLGLVLISSLSQAQSKGQNYPDRTVKMVVPLTTGSLSLIHI